MSVQKYTPTAKENWGKTYYVSQQNPAASDDNPGTELQPFKTISAAGARIAMGDVVMIDEGVYREEVPLVATGHQYGPETKVTFKAVSGKHVFLTGADVFDGPWTDTGDGLSQAPLPESLFADGGYNPYEIGCVIDDRQKVRPCAANELQLTLGQICVDGESLTQVTSTESLVQTPDAYLVSADGKSIVCNFGDGGVSSDALIELAVRRRCFVPQFSGVVHMEVVGMVVQYAAEPGVFCRSMPVAIRHNGDTGITVRKQAASVNGLPHAHYICDMAYLSVDSDTMIACTFEPESRLFYENMTMMTVVSKDDGLTWAETDAPRVEWKDQLWFCYYLDRSNNMLVRYTRHWASDAGAKVTELVYQVSADQGKTWSPEESLGSGLVAQYRIVRISDGTLIWSGYDKKNVTHTLIGTWREDLSGIDWEWGGQVHAPHQSNTSGVAEMHVTELPDGRLMAIARVRNMMVTQHDKGFPGVKLIVVSEDGGRSWSDPEPLAYDDGEWVHSPASFPDLIRPTGSDRVFAILNISDCPVFNCDPRTTLNIVEVDTDTLRLKRDRIAVIDTAHEEHHWYIRFSNLVITEDREGGKFYLFMPLEMAEACPIRRGYDLRVHRYEISFDD